MYRFEQILTCTELATTSPQFLNEIKVLPHPDMVQEGGFPDSLTFWLKELMRSACPHHYRGDRKLEYHKNIASEFCFQTKQSESLV